jgi:hypothetical protein
MTDNNEFKSSRDRKRRLATIAFAVIVVVVAGIVGKALMVRARMGGKDPKAIAKVLESNGTIVVIRGADAIPFEEDMTIEAGDCIRTLDDSRIKVQYIDKTAEVILEENTNMYLLSLIGGKRTNLAGGVAEFIIREQPADEPMIIATSNSAGDVLEPGHFRITFRDVVNRYDVMEAGKLSVRCFATGVTREVLANSSYEPMPTQKIDMSIFDEDTNF